MFSQLVALSVLLSSARATTTSLTTLTVDAVFSGAGVTPAVIPSFTSTSLLDIAFNGYTVSPGQYLSIDQATPNPQFWATTNVSTWGENQFTIAIVDPDSAAPQTLHYLATGLTLNASGPVNFAPFTNSTPAIFDYIPPNPSAGNPHRYVVMLFVQPSGFWRNEAEYVPAPSSRTDFNITAFSQNLGLGNPVAGSLWYTGATLLEASATVDSAPASSAAPAATNSTVAATSSSAAPSSVAAPTSTAATTSAAASSSATPLTATVVSTKPSQTLTPSSVPSKVRSSAVGSAASRGVGRAVAALAMLASGFVFAV